MCIEYERRPTRQEKKRTIGYKVFLFYQTSKSLTAPFYDYFYNKDKTDSEGFYLALPRLTRAQFRMSEVGFHVFLRKSDAEILAKTLREGYLSSLHDPAIPVIKKVRMRDIFGIGNPAGMGEICDRMTRVSVVRCGKIRILD